MASGRGREDRAVSEQIAALQPRLYARTLTHSPEEAADLAQEATVRALAAVGSFTPGTNLKAWLFRILRNVHLNRERQARHAPPTDSIDRLTVDLAPFDCPVSPVEHDVLLRADVSALREAFRALPRTFAEPLYLTAVEELSYAEAARRLEIPVGTVMSRVYRARRLLLARLAEGEQP